MTATFTYSPTYGSPKASAPRVLATQFGDGYEQRAVDGINPDLKSWDLTFTNRATTDADAIEAFLVTNTGLAFNWTPPGLLSSTTATNESFGTGDGTTVAFTLKKNGVAVRNVTASPQIYRNDWQGNQLLYATARTNLILQSEDIGTTWVSSNITKTLNATTAPDGTTTADKMVDNATNSTHFITQSLSGTADNTIYTISFFAKAAEFSSLDIYINKRDGSADSKAVSISAGSSDWTSTPAGGGWYRISRSLNLGTGASTPVFRVFTWNGTTNSYAGTGQGFYVWGFDIKVGSTLTSYIPTTTSAVTLTDYTVNLTTGVVTLAAAPLSAAALTWTGSFTPSYLWVCSAWRRTPVDYGIETITATFKQVLG
jgi:phage-related protein